MNYIGKKLKSLRQELGLTQTEMAAGVISVSFYSKVERGLNDIGVNDFLEILQKHNVSPKNFFGDYKLEKDNKRKVTMLMNKFVNAAYNNDEKEIDDIINELKQIKPRTAFIKFSIVQARLIKNTHNINKIKKLDKNQKNELKRTIFQKDTDENEYHRIILIANIIQVYSLDEATFLMNSILRRYKKNNNLDKKLMLALSVLIVNYVDWCCRKNKIELCYKPLKYLRSLPNDIELALTKILGCYYEDLINKQNVEANSIRTILIKSGYDENVKNMVK
ncbi:Rgg/GadR/MutR family transcriptional regulator [Lactobacillus kullabergensis]|nr:Rgg/GadR/MutR family transcriptional regulator [Lactobacillus kullabergensis]